MTSHPPLINMNANCVPTDPDLEHLVQAAYDTGHYAGNGQSGSNAHKAIMEERNEVWREVATRLDAADALATEVSPAIEIVKAACIYINMIGTGGERDERVIKALQTISGDLHTALRKYREVTDARN